MYRVSTEARGLTSKTMTQEPEIEVRAKLSLALVGTSITVASYEDAVEQLKRQAVITGRPQKLLVADSKPLMLQVDTVVSEAVFTDPDATLSVTGWELLVNGSVKVTLPKAEPLIARAKALASHQNIDHVLITSVMETQKVSTTGRTIQPEVEPAAPQQPEEQPLMPVVAQPVVTGETGQPQSQPTLDGEVSPNPVDLGAAIPDDQPAIQADDGSEHWNDDSEPIIEDREERIERSGSVPRRAFLIGLSAAAVLGVGSFAAYKLFGNPPRTPDASPADPSVSPVVEPPFPGVEPEPIQQFPMAYSDLAVSANGGYLAIQISDSEIAIQRTTKSEDSPEPGTSDGENISFDGKLAPPILPLAAEHGEGFILRILNSSGDLGASSKLLVWTPKNGVKTHELSIGSQLTSRGGQSWISSTIPSVEPRTVLAVTPTKLEKYTAPSYGPALFGLLPKSTALWASIESDNSASILTSNAKGKVSVTGVLKRPAKSAVVAKWITATADHALMLWKTTDGHVLVLHNTKTGEISNKSNFKLPSGTTADRLPSKTSTDGSIAIVGSTWANLKTGKFGPPEGFDLSKFQARPRPGGIELRSDTESSFHPESGSTFSVPNKGTVLAVTKEVVIVEESRLVSVYRKTTTEGK